MTLLTDMSNDRKIPKILIDAMADPLWPRGRISGLQLRHLNPRISGFEFELLQTREQLLRNDLADTETLIRFEESPKIRDFLALAAGTKCGHKVELPILDVEQILVIGGGTDWADDVWVALDFRAGFGDPQVVFNQFSNKSCEWLVIAKSFSEFCRAIGISVMAERQS